MISIQSTALDRFCKTSLLFLLLGGPMAHAQNEEGEGQQNRRTIEEIVVTARKREEPLQETPVAATVLSGMKLDLEFAHDLKSLPVPAPNVTISQKDFFSNAAHFAIRGLASDDIESTFDPPVATFVDGVYIPRPVASNLDLFDVEQIEILRGPQGTLFGRNTTGGAIQVRSRRPSGEFSVRGSLTVGEYGRNNVKAAIDIPIVKDRVNGKVAVQSIQSDGFFTSTISGNTGRTVGSHLGGEDIFAIRPMVVFTPSDDFDLTIIGEYHRNKSDMWPGRNSSDDSKILCAFHGYCASQTGGDPYVVDLTDGGDFDVTIWGVTVEANWDIEPGTLTLISNYRDTDSRDYINGDMTEATMFELTRREPHEQYSSELRLVSDDWGKIDFIGGLYYFHQQFTMIQRNFLTIFPNDPTVDIIRYFTQEHESYSAFAEIDYHFNDKLTGTIGARYSKDTKDFSPQLYGPYPGGGPTLEPASKDWDDVGPKIGIHYQWNPQLMTYASYTRGYKSGGFNGRCAQQATCNASFDPEQVDSFEIGLKADFFDQRVRTNLAVFYSEHDDLQQSAIVPLPADAADPQETVTANAASATISGVELEVSAILAEGLTLDLGVGYLDASYDEFCAAFGVTAHPTEPVSPCGGEVIPVGTDPNGVPTYLVDQDFSDLELRLAPEWTHSATLNYTVPVGTAGSINFNASYSHTSEMFTDARELSPRKSVSLVDASISYLSPTERYRVSLYGKNLTDETYVVMRNLAAQLWTTDFLNSPRHYGVEFSFEF